MTRKETKIEFTSRDRRDCPKCKTRMEFKGYTPWDYDSPTELWQCPYCHNVEFL